MRGADFTQEALFSYRTLEERIPADHPLRPLRKVVDSLLTTMDALYAKTGRESIPPERLLRASLIQVLFSIRSARRLVQHLDFNRLYRWFVGLTLDDAVWDHPSTPLRPGSTFSAHRERLLNERVCRVFFDRVLRFAEWQNLVSDEHFSVDGTLIEAWASQT